ncbi:hypothetical protein BZA05DRAFT_37628 [Tricharina praecox]|uniref:uncharacterized protein n=1 Tax=Tricharina praecox TaxID=43433 RepID=UPI0022206D73|nr:uncharacterized protein BZA05DRAFT_37628 [Tricharina praecox]KAI5852168.1 hypothetical protein BZA05DRAFT_37628 [Tricharina praecox]
MYSAHSGPLYRGPGTCLLALSGPSMPCHGHIRDVPYCGFFCGLSPRSSRPRIRQQRMSMPSIAAAVVHTSHTAQPLAKSLVLALTYSPPMPSFVPANPAPRPNQFIERSQRPTHPPSALDQSSSAFHRCCSPQSNSSNIPPPPRLPNLTPPPSSTTFLTNHTPPSPERAALPTPLSPSPQQS